MLNRTAPRRGKQNLAVRPLFCPYNQYGFLFYN